MGKPIVLYESLADPEYVTYQGESGLQTEVSGFPYVNAFSPFTFPADTWKINRGTSYSFSAGVTIALSIQSPFDSLGIVIRGLEEGEVCRVSLYKVSGSAIYMLYAVPVTNGVHLLNFDLESPSGATYSLVLSGTNVTSSDSLPIEVPVILIGKAMEFEKCIMKSYAPLDYNRATEYMTNESGTGQFMGRSIVRRNHESSVSFDLMSAAWVRSTFQPFVRHARTKPYFFAWNYDDYPEEVNYVWTDEDIGVSYTGDRDKMSASWKMRGLGNDPE